ncbi:hypothetical protein [Metallibacterium sp.]|uniref:hypothetical protein n=1 Tax=Metallibacterium sp. TaxID=2940281 RepID=UPI00260462D9|nr:hypothetical protein [Metallibacterium sp.]
MTSRGERGALLALAGGLCWALWLLVVQRLPALMAPARPASPSPSPGCCWHG